MRRSALRTTLRLRTAPSNRRWCYWNLSEQDEVPPADRLKVRQKKWKDVDPSWPKGGVAGVVLNIDGVIQRGGTVLPGVRQAVRALDQADIPVVYYSDGYPGWEEEAFSANLTNALGVNVGVDEVILASSSAFTHLAPDLKEKSVLVIGPKGSAAKLRSLGYPKAISIEGVAHARPHHVPGFRHETEPDWSKVSGGIYRVDAIVIVGEPSDWGAALQISMDVLQTKKGVVNGESELRDLTDVLQPIPVYTTDARKFVAGLYEIPRLSTAAFTESLKSLYSSMNAGRTLNVTALNRHSPSTQAFIQSRLQEVSNAMGHTKPLSHIYNVTDNLENDGMGVSAVRTFDPTWWSILVGSGVCKDGNKILGVHSFMDLVETQDEAFVSYPDRKRLVIHLEGKRADAAYLSLAMFVSDLLSLEYMPSQDEMQQVSRA